MSNSLSFPWETNRLFLLTVSRKQTGNVWADKEDIDIARLSSNLSNFRHEKYAEKVIRTNDEILRVKRF